MPLSWFEIAASNILSVLTRNDTVSFSGLNKLHVLLFTVACYFIADAETNAYSRIPSLRSTTLVHFTKHRTTKKFTSVILQCAFCTAYLYRPRLRITVQPKLPDSNCCSSMYYFGLCTYLRIRSYTNVT